MSTENLMKKRIGIITAQSIIKKATQSNLSMFHNAGNIGNMDDFIFPKPSITDILDLNPNMSCSTEAIFTEYIYKKEFCKLYTRDILIRIVHSKYIDENSSQNCFYDFLDKPRSETFLRFYFNIRKIVEFGYNLYEISEIIFANKNVVLSPDFMGIIDLDLSDKKDIYSYYNTDYLLNHINSDIKNIYIISKHKVAKLYTIGSNIMSMLLNKKVDNSSIISNNILDVEKRFGIEAANQLIQDLLEDSSSYIISDFMTRTGDIIRFDTISLIKNNREFITSISFQHPRQNIVKYFKINKDNGFVIDNNLSIYSKIYEGLNFTNNNIDVEKDNTDNDISDISQSDSDIEYD
jgi:hypothetical protein